METAGIILAVGLIVFVSHLFTGIFDKRMIPDVLLLMLLGIFVGPILGLVSPAEFGIVGPMFTTITLVVILFEGGLDLKIESLRSAIKGSLSLTFINFFVTVTLVGLISWVIFRMNLLDSLILGAILGGTSSAVVIPLVRKLKVTDSSRTIMILESAFSDVLCIVFTLALLEVYRIGNVNVGLIIGKVIASFALAGFMGWVGAIVWSFLLLRIRTIKNSIFTTPAFVFIIYGVSEMLGYSGAISSLVFGFTLANISLFNLSILKKYTIAEPITLNQTEKIFFSEVVFLLKTFFFIYIGLSISFNSFWTMTLGLILTIVIYISRIPIVKLSTNKITQTYDKTIMSIMVPKGLAAAVLASIPYQMGIEGGEFIRDIIYAIILISITLTSILVYLVEKVGWVGGLYGFFHRKGIAGFFAKRGTSSTKTAK
jgi:NhaP-type Na+/H+ or K+/H+ antiporter